MDKQVLFDRVITHLFAQGGPAKRDGYYCCYRTPDGKSCAVGCLIADEHYNPELENGTAHAPRVQQALKLSGIEVSGISEFLRELQLIHDFRFKTMKVFLEECVRLGNIERLDVSLPQQLMGKLP
jgi:hypothetical protein